MNENQDSVIDVVSSIKRRKDILAKEAARLDLVIAAYATQAKPTNEMPVLPAVQHYYLTEGAECGCPICTEWDVRRTEFINAGSLIPKGHKWSTCSCSICRFVGRIHLNFLASTNTRDLLIETSYHAQHHSPFGDRVMQWLAIELTDPRYTVNWRAQEMSRYPLEWWFKRCESVLGPQVSGAVFRDGMHKVDMYVHFSSSLMADGEMAFG